jgi:hypothetical protein
VEKKATHTPQTIAAELDAAERITLFCLATGTRRQRRKDPIAADRQGPD